MAIDRIRLLLRAVAFLGVATIPCGTSLANDMDSRDQVRQAIAYLDARQEAWSRFASAGRGTAEDKTTCVSCHTGISYALTRPSLGPFVGGPALTSSEEKRITDVTRRVEHWVDLDSPRFRLMYDFDERKKVESKGTEAVLDTLILARNDVLRARTEPSSVTRTSLTHLWKTQETEGVNAGSWNWLNFGLEPWEGEGSRAFGAALASLAVASVPGYLDGTLAGPDARGVALLHDYLKRRFPQESLHNRLWILEASVNFKDLVSTEQKREALDQLRAAQQDDGGWTLSALGKFRRVDGTNPSKISDGYATGLAIHALIIAGETNSRPEITRGVGWLRSHQRADGSWPGISVNKERDPSTFTGKLMSDAATAFAARALIESEAR